MKKWMIALVVLSLIFLTGINGCGSQEVVVGERSEEVTITAAPKITANPESVIMTTSGDCYPEYCTVFQNIVITSSTAWTSTPPGFGSLREGFEVSPASGPAGSTTVTITYRYQIPEPNDGFIRFRTDPPGEYVEVPVRVNVGS